MKKVCLITGAASGLGLALLESLARTALLPSSEFDLVVGVDRDYKTLALWTADFCEADISTKDGWDTLCIDLSRKGMEVSCLINCCGVNHIDYLENLCEDDFDRLMDVNAKAIYLGSKMFQSDLAKHKGTILNITSNASHIPMTASLAYNASKAAAHIMTQQMARELTRRHGITVFGVAPNKLIGTGMSSYIEERVPELRGWTPAQAKAYQEASLLAGETPPERVAELIAFLLSSKERHQHLTGCILPYGA